MRLKFRAWNPKTERYIYSYTVSGNDRLGWFFANTKGLQLEQERLTSVDGEYYYVPVTTNYDD